jgi:hypothetical protein
MRCNGLARFRKVVGDVCSAGFRVFHGNPETLPNWVLKGRKPSVKSSRQVKTFSTLSGPDTARPKAPNHGQATNARLVLRQLQWTASFERHLMVPFVSGYFFSSQFTANVRALAAGEVKC